MIAVASSHDLGFPFTCVPAKDVLKYDSSILQLRKILGALGEILQEEIPL